VVDAPARDASGSVAVRNRVTYERLYSDTTANGSYEVRNKTRVVRRMARHLRPPFQRILDVGFGTGDNLAVFAGAARQLVGIEPILTPSITVRRDRPDIPMLGTVADAQALPFRDTCFDLVIFSHVLEHLTNGNEALAEIRRVLCPNGLAIVLVPCRDLEVNPLHVRRYDPASLRAACLRVGLVPVRQIAVGSRLLEGVLRLMLRLSAGIGDARSQPGLPSRHGRLRSWYHRFAVPLMLAYSQLDDRIAALQRCPLETALLARRAPDEGSH
jgi:SAM-dependent methyltransferase